MQSFLRIKVKKKKKKMKGNVIAPCQHNESCIIMDTILHLLSLCQQTYAMRGLKDGWRRKKEENAGDVRRREASSLEMPEEIFIACHYPVNVHSVSNKLD